VALTTTLPKTISAKCQRP